MWSQLPDIEVCERARQSRDARFDGRFFVAVLTTGIFCRPVCPARTPARENVRFYPSVATALEAGYRPCLRCRPEQAPAFRAATTGSPSVQQALARIEAGALDHESVAQLARAVDLSSRQLTRQFVCELGVPPGAIARARRVAMAKQLIDETNLPFTHIAALAGFGSLRRFNEAVQALWARPPSALRSERRNRVIAATHTVSGAPQVHLQLALRPPYHREWMLGYLRQRAVAGVERVEGDTWIRSIPGGEVRVQIGAHALAVSMHGDPTRIGLASVLQRVRRVFDVGADGRIIDAHLGNDARLRDVVRADPGLRVPGAWDGFELAVRAILGQQVSVAGATTLAGRLLQRFGVNDGDGRLLWPDAHALRDANIAAIGMPETRGEAIRGLARAVLEDRVQLDAGQSPDGLREQLQALPGIGPWTAQYVAMRALGHPDAFPAEDIVLRKALDPNVTSSVRALTARAEAWRPWRAYAVMYLWRDAARQREAHRIDKQRIAKQRPMP